jgi:hypothetical protein
MRTPETREDTTMTQMKVWRWDAAELDWIYLGIYDSTPEVWAALKAEHGDRLHYIDVRSELTIVE